MQVLFSELAMPSKDQEAVALRDHADGLRRVYDSTHIPEHQRIASEYDAAVAAREETEATIDGQ